MNLNNRFGLSLIIVALVAIASFSAGAVTGPVLQQVGITNWPLDENGNLRISVRPVPGPQPTLHTDRQTIEVFGDTLVYIRIGTPLNFSFVFAPRQTFQTVGDVWLNYVIDENSVTAGAVNGLNDNFRIEIGINTFSYIKSSVVRTGANFATPFSDHLGDAASGVQMGVNTISFAMQDQRLDTGSVYGEFHLRDISIIIQYDFLA